MLSSVELFRSTNGTQEQASRLESAQVLFHTELSVLEPEVRAFALRGVVLMLHVTDQESVREKYVHEKSKLEESLRNWLRDAAHGPAHSYAVYQRMMELRDAELDRLAGQEDRSGFDVENDQLEIRALLHDFGEFLPIEKYPSEQVKSAAWRAQQHAQLMALTISRVGRVLEITDAPQLATDVLTHDLYWSKPTAKKTKKKQAGLSGAGQLLADADRLVGVNPEDEIHRNRLGSLGKWYLFRELTAQERMLWVGRTKGIFDGLCALLVEFTGQDHWMHTTTGRERNSEKRARFRTELVSYYRAQYRQSWQLLRDGLEQGLTVQVGIKGEDTRLVKEVLFTKEMNSAQITAQCAQLLNTPVPGKEHEQFSDRLYYGYSLQVGKEWIDPSIIRFASEDELEAALLNAVKEYEEYNQDTGQS